MDSHPAPALVPQQRRRRRARQGGHPPCCGLDIHKKTVVACVLLTSPNGHVQREVRTYGTMTTDLLALSDWLTQCEVTQIAMESTGVFWRPVFNLLEDD